jgi:SAM-dependent methyltransferase
MKIRNESDFDALIWGTKLLAVAAAWTELGLWNELARRPGPVDLTDLPGDARALEITARVLAHAGLLDGSGRRYAMSDVARELHEKGQLPTRMNFDILGDLSRMADVLRDGGPVRGADGKPKLTSGGVSPGNPDASRRFLDMLYRRSETAARTTAKWLAPRLSEGAHIIDVGGGHGRYAEELRALGLRVTLFDLPMVVELARERHADRLDYRAGDFQADDLGGPYDAALLSNIVHSESFEQNQELLRRVHAALRPGGIIVIKDMLVDDFGRYPEHAVFFGTTMLYYTAQGSTYTLSDIGNWCGAAGFEALTSVSVSDHVLAFAKKPSVR